MTNLPQPSEAELRPKFLDIIENGYASDNNPNRVGYYIRSGRRTGKLNPGKYFVLTDGNGEFWEAPANNERLHIIGNLLAAHNSQAQAEVLDKVLELRPRKVSHDSEWHNIDGPIAYNTALSTWENKISELKRAGKDK